MKKVTKTTLTTIENLIRKNPSESVYIINKEGKILWNSSTGIKSVYGHSVDISTAGNIEGTYLTHNHPPQGGEKNNSFSIDDIKVLYAHNLLEIRAVSTDYTYTMKLKQPGKYLDIQATVSYIGTQLDREIKESFKNTGEFPFDDYNHQLWTRTSKIIDNMKYKRN